MKPKTTSTPKQLGLPRAYVYGPSLQKIADHQIDRMIIRARKERLPMWAVEQRENGSWANLTFDTPQNIETYFKVYQPTMLALARTSQE